MQEPGLPLAPSAVFRVCDALRTGALLEEQIAVQQLRGQVAGIDVQHVHARLAHAGQGFGMRCASI